MLAVRSTQLLTVTNCVASRSPIAPLAFRQIASSIDSTKEFEIRTFREQSGSMPSAQPPRISIPSMTTSLATEEANGVVRGIADGNATDVHPFAP
jgi:hypothetical protein